MSNRLLNYIEKLSVHDHLCLLHESQKEQFAAVLPFIRIGLMRGEKCIYVADENTVDQVICAMRADGIDVDIAMSKKALVIVSKKQTYLKQGYFNPDEMIQYLKESVDSAKKDGFSALRVTGEMTWILGQDPGTMRLMEYESKLNHFFPENDCLAICQYNLNRFSPETIMGVIKTHPLVIVRGVVCKNFYYIPPEEFLEMNNVKLEVERLIHNLIDREKAEEALQKSQSKFSSIYQQSLIAIELYDSKGLLIDANPKCLELFGVNDIRKIIGFKLFNDPNLSDKLKIKISLGEVVKFESEFDFETVKKMGLYETSRFGRIYIDCTISPWEIEGDQPGYLVHVMDITERKKYEYKILKLNRVYSVISQINQAIVRVHEKDKIIGEACRIAVEYGKFRLAWIGLIDEKTKLVYPAAYSGVEDGYLSMIKKISIEDVSIGRGPTGTAIRENRYYVCDDIEKDPRMVPWKEEALKRGYRSSIALPIKHFGNVIGAFNIYSSVPYFFDQEEIQLLDELTNNISFAITSIEIAMKKKEAEEALEKSEEKYRRLTENAKDMIYRMSIPEGKYEYVSPASKEIFGYSPEEFYRPSMLIKETIHPDWRDYFSKQWANLVKGEMPSFYEYQIIHKSGKVKWLHQRNVLFKDENGKVVAIEGVVTDITDRKHAEEELSKYREHLEELVKERTAELNKKNEELEQFNRLFVGRELRMIELKKIIEENDKRISEKDKKIFELEKEIDIKKRITEE